jgi:hypothetical protein
MLIAYLLCLHGINHLLKQELIPRRDLHRAGVMVKNGGQSDLVGIQNCDIPVLDGLIFRKSELEQWAAMPSAEQEETLCLANRRKELVSAHSTAN